MWEKIFYARLRIPPSSQTTRMGGKRRENLIPKEKRYKMYVWALTLRAISQGASTSIKAVARMCRLECSSDAPAICVFTSEAYLYSYVWPGCHANFVASARNNRTQSIRVDVVTQLRLVSPNYEITNEETYRVNQNEVYRKHFFQFILVTKTFLQTFWNHINNLTYLYVMWTLRHTQWKLSHGLVCSFSRPHRKASSEVRGSRSKVQNMFGTFYFDPPCTRIYFLM